MAIKIEMLRSFSAVAEAGNLGDAATRLGRTQSAVSMTLKQLEDHLGRRLFVSDRKNQLTPVGQQIFELAGIELRQFDDTIKAIQAAAVAPQGLVRVASVPSVAGLMFPSMVQKFRDVCPGTKIELRDTDSQQVVDALSRGKADIGIASSHHTLNGIQQTPLFSDRFGLICSPRHPLAYKAGPIHLTDVVSDAFIKNDLCLSVESESFQELTSHADLSARNTLSLIAMVRSDKWVTILPKAVLHIAPSDLVFREISDLTSRRQVSLLLREKSPFQDYAEKLKKVILSINWETLISAG
ncbi:LysR family transcriptional regulator [Sedimentitalea sp. CY04]|uniref:LysR family transcriptional regulator n=1 Tax=Parasedimentitalea denitrificans TaxID=2211118 RepID=A0ABX0W3M9_9RHOB|nr:LysR family transcriptional regulator [Sedimentitalea sp. CY04]NIZ60227.1 LysR family transcriptional regulator [Sedimentitalea sp. CY04]